jgi:hypothetical protein
MGDVPTFMIKGDAPAFVMGDGTEDAPTFVIKGDVPLADRLLLPSIKPVPLLGDAGASHFSRSETIALARIFDQCLLFEFLT